MKCQVPNCQNQATKTILTDAVTRKVCEKHYFILIEMKLKRGEW